MTKHDDRKSTSLVHRFSTLLSARRPLRGQAEDWAEGHRASTDAAGGIGSAGGASDPTLARVLRTPEGHGLADQCVDVADRIDAWARQGNALAYAVSKLLPLDHPVAEMLAKHRDVRQAGAGMCQCCGRNVPGIRENPLLDIRADRLKAGFCFGPAGNCYDAWTAAGRPLARTQFAETHHPKLGRDETPGPGPVTPDGVQLPASGAEVRPPAA